MLTNIFCLKKKIQLIVSHSTCAVDQILVRLLKPRTSKFKKSPYYRAIEAWNAIDNDLRAISDPTIPKMRLKAYFLGISL